MTEWVRFIAVVIAAGIVGNWFMSVNRRNKAEGAPWYKAYCSVPGMIIIVAIIVVPLAMMFLKE